MKPGISTRLGARLLQDRRAARMPVPLFRIGLGFLFTRRLLMLEHTGRKSGKVRYVALEVVQDCVPGSLVVASGFGRRAQWFQNVMAHPECRVSVGFTRRAEARASLLGPGETQLVLAQYQSAHPEAWDRLLAVIVEATDEESPQIPLVRLSLQE